MAELLQLGLASVAQGGRKAREGVEHMSRLLKLCEATFGESAPECLAASYYLALAHLAAGEPARAAELLRDDIKRAYRLLEPSLAPCLLASLHVALGAALHAQRQYDGAEELFLHALDLIQDAYGRDDPAASSVHANLGLLHLERGLPAKLPEARRQMALALRRAQCVMGTRQTTLAALHRGLAECAAREGDWAAALVARRQAVAIYARELGADDEATADARVELAQAHLRLRDGQRALGELIKARAIYAARAAAAPDQPHAAAALDRACRLVACAYSGLGRYADASAELRSARARSADTPRMLQALEVLATSSASHGSRSQ
jgi:tetratricopeptide (TPR) repeat protein